MNYRHHEIHSSDSCDHRIFAVQRKNGKKKNSTISASPECSRSKTRLFQKHSGKIFMCVESGLTGNIPDRQIGFPQQFYCMANPALGDIMRDRDPVTFGESPAQTAPMASPLTTPPDISSGAACSVSISCPSTKSRATSRASRSAASCSWRPSPTRASSSFLSANAL